MLRRGRCMTRKNGGRKEQTKERRWEPWEWSSEHRDDTSARLGLGWNRNEARAVKFYFHLISCFATTAIVPSKNNTVQNSYVLTTGSHVCKTIEPSEQNPATLTTLAQRALVGQNGTNCNNLLYHTHPSPLGVFVRENYGH